MEATRILVVDDDPIQLVRLSGVLGSQYQVDTIERAGDIPVKLQQAKPDLIILDIELPDGNGIDICRTLKRDNGAKLPIVFHSSHDSLDERMEAYEAGGDDFFLKTMSAQELVAKVAVLLDWVSRNRSLEGDRQAAEETARSVKGDLGEFAIALEALRHAGTATDLTTLANVGVDALTDWRIDANVQIRAGRDRITLNRRGHSTPLEVSIIHNSRLSGQQFQFRDRLVLNFPNASILIRNMPQDSPVQAQRVRDLATVLGEALDARARALEAEFALQERNRLSISLADQAERALKQLQQEWLQRQFQVAETLQKLREGLEQQFLSMALNSKEEQACLNRLQSGMEELQVLFARHSQADETLAKLKERLQKQA